MKPLAGTYAANAREWGVAGINIDGCRIAANDGADLARANKPGDNGWKNASGGLNGAAQREANGLPPLGRWPANLLLDETAAAMLDAQSGELRNGGQNATSRNGKMRNGVTWRNREIGEPTRFANETGGASRFFYVAKASRAERNAGLDTGNNHPTVKPLQLLRMLARLTATPTGGEVLDPFFGSGTTGVACLLEGRSIVGIDKEADYCYNIALPRLEHAAKELERLQQQEAPQPSLLEGFPNAG
jgi:hypothetical protein